MSNYFNKKNNVFLCSFMPEDLKNVVCKTKPGDYVPYLCSFECPPLLKMISKEGTVQFIRLRK